MWSFEDHDIYKRLCWLKTKTEQEYYEYGGNIHVFTPPSAENCPQEIME